MQREERLAERDGVGQGTQTGQIQAGDRHDRQVLELIRTLLLFSSVDDVRDVGAVDACRHDWAIRLGEVQAVQGEGSMDTGVVAPDVPRDKDEQRHQ
jgi:hypothetical protein